MIRDDFIDRGVNQLKGLRPFLHTTIQHVTIKINRAEIKSRH